MSLSRLKVGIDVPYVTSWSEEAAGGVGPCPTVDGAVAALQTWKPGVGRPMYSRNHLRRQRDTVRAMLCPMCGEPTPADDRWHQTGRFRATGSLRAAGFARALPAGLSDDTILLDAGAIAPLHRQCADASLARCPHLGGMPDRELKPFPAAWVVVPLYAAARQGAGPPVRVVTFLQLVGVTDSRDPGWRERPAAG